MSKINYLSFHLNKLEKINKTKTRITLGSSYEDQVSFLIKRTILEDQVGSSKGGI